jgi:hypothetical protein
VRPGPRPPRGSYRGPRPPCGRVDHPRTTSERRQGSPLGSTAGRCYARWPAAPARRRTSPAGRSRRRQEHVRRCNSIGDWVVDNQLQSPFGCTTPATTPAEASDPKLPSGKSTRSPSCSRLTTTQSSFASTRRGSGRLRLPRNSGRSSSVATPMGGKSCARLGRAARPEHSTASSRHKSSGLTTI